jgi:hypothetical protein
MSQTLGYGIDWSWLHAGILQRRYFEVKMAVGFPCWPADGKIDFGDREWLYSHNIIEVVGFERLAHHKYPRLKIEVTGRTKKIRTMECGIPDFIDLVAANYLRPCGQPAPTKKIDTKPSYEKRGYEFL